MESHFNPDVAESLPWTKGNMDNGKQPFVYDEQKRRWMVSAKELQENGFVSGQTIPRDQLILFLETKLAKARTELALAQSGCYPKGM